MTDLRVLITDYTWDTIDREISVLAEVGATAIVAERGSEEELLELVRDADAILTCFAHVTAAVIDAGTKLQVVGRYGIGVDNIAVEQATRLGIPVTNVPAYCLDEVAEHVLALLLCMARGIHHFDRNVRGGNWSLADGEIGAPIRRVAGRTLGVIGFGKIGRTVAQRARGIGLNVIAYDPHATAEQIAAAEVEPVDLPELAARADFITLHVPATSETRGLVNREFIARMKPDARLINTARGSVIDQDALFDALHEGRIAGAGLDVFVPERLDPDDRLLAESRLLATPHVAFYSTEAVAELASSAARNVAMVLAGKRPSDTVNPEVYQQARWAHLKTSGT